MSKNTLRTN